MYYLSNNCFICLKDVDKLQIMFVNGTEDIVKQMKYVLPEITLKPEIPVHICSTCHIKLYSFCTFKKQCLENYCHFTEKLRESGNAKDQSFNALPIETIYIKEENQVDDDLINEAPEELNSLISCITEEDMVKAVQDETISPGLNKNISDVSGKTEVIKSFECEEQHDQTNNFIEDIYIKEDIIKFGDSDGSNLHQQLADIKTEIDSEQDINKIKSDDLNIKKSKRYQCSICEKKFLKSTHLKLHTKIHTGVKDLECSICEKKFLTQSNLNMHIKTHTGVKDYKCSICEKKFIRKSHLNRHMAQHTGIKDFPCTICEKKYTENSQLNVHMKIHSGVKEFQCSICEKKFTLQCHLNDHMKIHTGVKDFKCSICEKKFITNSALKQHMKIHTGVKNFQCSNCEKKFKQNSHLKQHMKLHTGVQDFQCSICEKKFTQQGGLNLHITRFH